MTRDDADEEHESAIIALEEYFDLRGRRRGALMACEALITRSGELFASGQDQEAEMLRSIGKKLLEEMKTKAPDPTFHAYQQAKRFLDRIAEAVPLNEWPAEDPDEKDET